MDERRPRTRRWLDAAAALTILGGACGGGTSLIGDGGDGEPWRPPIEDIGESGWRDSTEPWVPPALPDCRFTRFFPLDVWCEPGGVVASYGWDEFEVTPEGGARGLGTYFSVAHNDGTGWVEWFRPTCGSGGSGATCVYMLDGRLAEGILGHGVDAVGLITPEGVASRWSELVPIEQFWVVNEHLAYALWSERVVRFDGTGWSPLPAEPPSGSYKLLWGDETELWIAGNDGAVAEWTGDSWRIHSAGTIADFTAIWGMGDRRVWLASGGALRFHDLDDTWSEVPWPDASADAPCRGDAGIRGFWGAGEVLFFHTGDQVIRWDGVNFEVLGYWPARREGGNCVGGLVIAAMWGNTTDEVFFAVMDRNTSVTPECPGGYGSPGRPFVLYWDGTTFHWM
ncbi:MAG: hypothetical protein HY905_18310 [Deltaproteobacteria bacterium]|nr:hypothetical protein [Deltaproteobacteria bacterium]